MFRSPRYLAFRHAQRASRKKGTESELDEDIKPGQEHLRSFFIPGLQAGWHTIKVTQPVAGNNESETLETLQRFNVKEPRFVLPDGVINTTYPPEGSTTTSETLPHVVFNSPTLPWERVGSRNGERPFDPFNVLRNYVPWVAVFIFTEDELKLSAEDLSGSTSIFSNVPSLKNGVKQDATFALTIPVNELSLVGSTVTPYTNDVTGDTTAASTIFLKRELFAGLFSQYNAQGTAEPTDYPYVQHHRYLAHKRVINTEGMAVVGAENPDDNGSFGVVVSHRSGPSSITVPTTVYAHLVSIEGIEQMSGFPSFGSTTRFVALVSLARWSYVCQPPDALNIRDRMIHVGKTANVLRSQLPEGTREKIMANPRVGAKLLQRVDQGYTLARYRTQSGETTSCFNRGPFVPVKPYKLPEWFPKTSMVGSDLSIIDQDSGLPDISYSAAWQLGRTMAISDQAFTTSLYRVRTQIIDRATEETRAKYARRYTHHKSKVQLLVSLTSSLRQLSSIGNSEDFVSDRTLRRRWERRSVIPLDLSYHSPIVDSSIDVEYSKAAREVASTPKPGEPTMPSDKPYDEFNAPFSADWVIVLRWVLDRLFLDSIPAHYLIPDSSLLPQESLRFFMIDDNWMDCYLDGALSLGNHIDQQSDKVRDAIKGAIKWYLESNTSVTAYPPPIPRYGCYLRSGLISQLPDLIVKVEPQPAVQTDVAPVLLSHNIVDKGCMLCLFAQPPSSATFTKLTLTQPPHQQSFIVGEKLTSREVEVSYRRAYTVQDPTDPDYDVPFHQAPWKRGVVSSDKSVMYLWNAPDPVSQAAVTLNMLLMDNYAPDYNAVLNQLMPAVYYHDDEATSALMAWQLNYPSYLLPIGSDVLQSGPSPRRSRTLPVSERTPSRVPEPPMTLEEVPGTGENPAYLEARQSRKHYVPQAARNPMGRYAKVIDELPISSISPGGDLDDDFPKFEFYFWSAEHPGTPDDQGTIPMIADVNNNPMEQDLVFSINCIENAYPDYRIESIEINIKQGLPPTVTVPSEGPLTTIYEGPGASMLSNLRFNPIISISVTYDNLKIRLIPRSQKGYVTADRCINMSFMLEGVKVNISPADVIVRPEILINYTIKPPHKPTQFPPPFLTLRPVPSDKQGQTGTSTTENTQRSSENFANLAFVAQ